MKTRINSRVFDAMWSLYAYNLGHLEGHSAGKSSDMAIGAVYSAAVRYFTPLVRRTVRPHVVVPRVRR